MMNLFNLFGMNMDDMLNMYSNYPKENDPNFNKTVEKSETETHVTEKETWISLDGKQSFTRVISKSKSKQIGDNVQDLRASLEKAIQNEDYESAITLRDKIKKLEAKKEN